MGDGPTKHADVPRNASATVKAPSLRVYVRESFFVPDAGECWIPGSGISKLGFELDGKKVEGKRATTNNPHVIAAGLLLRVPLHPALQTPTRIANRGGKVEGSEATLSLASVSDGDHVLKVIPDPSRTSTEPAGPATDSTEERLYRPLHVRLSIKGGSLVKAEVYNPDAATAKVTHGHVTAFDEDELCIDLKPDWMKTAAVVAKRSQGCDLIVIHHTGDKVIGPALNEALTAKGPHYEIDNEGHVVKFVADDAVAAHAGVSRWDGKQGCNANAIGIELVHFQPAPSAKQATPTVEQAQYEALIKLLFALVGKLGIKPHRIVGHSDIRTTKADPFLLGSDRQTCPGGMFEWTRLENVGLGMIPKRGVDIEDDWGGYFEVYPEPLRFGDSDTTKTYGGKRRKDVSGVIREMQLDLSGIGYSVKVTGEFDEYTRQAVDRFKRHFFTGSRSAQAPKSLAVSGDIDRDTATMIVAVRMGLPSAPSLPHGMRDSGGDERDHAYALDADSRDASDIARG